VARALRPVASLDAAVDVLDNRHFRNLTVRRLTFCKPWSRLAVLFNNRELSHRAWFHMTNREFHFRAQCDNESQSREIRKAVSTDTKSITWRLMV
jgi:hypothetical protein